MDPTIDVHAPLIGQDGLEYLNFAAYLEGRPIDCRRNTVIRQKRAEGWSAEHIDFWLRFHDEPPSSSPT